MICQADAKSLEIYTAAYLSQDPVMMQELTDGLDMHGLNQEAFNLPSRLISKVLNFRILYGGTGYSFAHDPDFTSVSKSEKYWDSKIEAFYNKYKGLEKWHNTLIQTVVETGQLIMPTGRSYRYERNKRGEWPVTTIKNYPVQGCGADIMSVARVSFSNRFKKEGIDGLQVNTVHDSIVVDVADYEVERVARMFHSVFDDLPKNFERVFKVPFNLPLRCEVSVGKNMKELEEINLDG